MSPESLNALRAQLKRLVIRECNVKNLAPEQIGDEDAIIGGQGPLVLDSLDAVEIVSALERSFDLKLENAGAARGVVKSFRAMSDFVIENAPPEKIQAFLLN
jgi:acyl carrier protein